MLAVYCRAENNRLFLKRNVEMRPGFLGKWIEYIIYDQEIEAPHEDPTHLESLQ
jgi:hypothetical protein